MTKSLKLHKQKPYIPKESRDQDLLQNNTLPNDWKELKGEFFSLKDSNFVVVENEDIDATYIDSSGNLCTLFKLRTKVLDKNNIENAWDSLHEMAKKVQNNNRGVASGKVDLDQIKKYRPNFNPTKMSKFRVYGTKKDGTPSDSHIGNFTNSSVIGWIDTRLRNKAGNKQCRMTQFSVKEMDKYKSTFPLLRQIDQIFENNEPSRHKTQLLQAQKTIAQIDNTSFSTITVNYDFRTALHLDAGDFSDGFGCIVVINQPNDPVNGGELMFPEFNVAIRLGSRDVLLFDPHQWHCTAPLDNKVHRLSLVCYLRENLINNCPHTSSLAQSLSATMTKQATVIKPRPLIKKKINKDISKVGIQTCSQLDICYPIKGKSLSMYYRKGTTDEKAIGEVFKQQCYNKNGISVEKGDVWLDLGGNIGSFSVWALYNGAKKVISIEPFEENISLLRKNLDLIGDKTKWQIEQCAVRYHVPKNKSEHVLYVCNGSYNKYRHTTRAVRGRKSVKIEFRPFEDFLTDEITAIKMDIEGDEREILLNCKDWKNVRKLVYEYHFAGTKEEKDAKHFHNVIKTLKANGFTKIVHKAVQETGIPNFFPCDTIVYCSR